MDATPAGSVAAQVIVTSLVFQPLTGAGLAIPVTIGPLLSRTKLACVLPEELPLHTF